MLAPEVTVGMPLHNSDGHAASSKALVQWVCTRRAFVPIQQLCSTKQLIWSLTRIMSSKTLQGQVGTKVAASDGPHSASSSKALVQQMCALSSWPPI
eukprot:3933430-Rhodomonas_salina.13